MIPKILIKYLVGLIIIIFVIWNHVIRTRSTITLEQIPVTYYKIGILVILITFSLIVIILNIRTVLNFKSQPGFLKKGPLQKILNMLREYVAQTPQELYKYLIEKNDLDLLLEKPASYFTAYCIYPRIIAIGLLELPKVIISTIFFIDIIFLNSLKYFFISLYILIPVIILQVLRFMINTYSLRRKKCIEAYLSFTAVANDTKKGYMIKLKPLFPQEHLLSIVVHKINGIRISVKPPHLQKKQQITLCHSSQILTILTDSWYIYDRMHYYMAIIEGVRIAFNPYFTIYTSFCYLFGWSYYLYFMLT